MFHMLLGNEGCHDELCVRVVVELPINENFYNSHAMKHMFEMWTESMFEYIIQSSTEVTFNKPSSIKDILHKKISNTLT